MEEKEKEKEDSKKLTAKTDTKEFSYEDLKEILNYYEDDLEYLFNKERHNDFLWLSSIQTNKTPVPERLLFISVFLQALLDATKPETKEEPISSEKARQSALKWFTVPSCVTASTYEPICELAGIAPDYGRKFFNRILSKDLKFVHRRINVLLNSAKE